MPSVGCSSLSWTLDPESIPHPKKLIEDVLEEQSPGKSYREVDDGGALLGKLDLEEVLKNPGTCGYLRAAYRWTADSVERATDQPEVWAYFCLRERFHLNDGILAEVTRYQRVAE